METIKADETVQSGKSERAAALFYDAENIVHVRADRSFAKLERFHQTCSDSGV